MDKKRETPPDALHEGREDSFIDIDRMVSEGLGGGFVSPQNGLIEETTTDTMDEEANTDEEGTSHGR